DPAAALDETLRSFAIEPRNPKTQEEILRLSRVTGRWEEAIKVQGQLFALADELPEKLAVARSAAHLVEYEVKDLVRAFRAYLNAFRLAPDDEEVVGHLWRLATSIGRYRDKELPAPTADELAEADRHAAGGTNGVSEAESAIGDEELLEEEELGDEELVARPPSPPPLTHADDDEQPYDTPWEELAAAYESLPAEDADDRWVYLRKIAEVWEKGQHDVERALDALERAFRLDITDVEVRAELERLGEQYDKWERVAEIYLRAIDEFGPIETAVTLHHYAARV